jgi:hypothetical protein
MNVERRLMLTAPLLSIGACTLPFSTNTHGLAPLVWLFRFGAAALSRTASAGTTRAVVGAGAKMVSTRAAGLAIGGKYALISGTAYTLAVQYNAQAIFVQGDLNVTVVETLNRVHNDFGNVTYRVIDAVTGIVENEEGRTLAKDAYQFDIKVPDLNEGVKSILLRAKNQEFRSPNFLVASRNNFRWEV